jgi:hypothetical protein
VVGGRPKEPVLLLILAAVRIIDGAGCDAEDVMQRM